MARISNVKSNVLGWGADLDPHNRPGVPREKNRETVTQLRGTSEYELIPRQVPRVEILVSTEHKMIPPIFGTSCPPHGISGILRRLAFKLSEGKKAHWMILLFADRVDVIESAVSNLLRFKSHNPFNEYGLQSEFRKNGFFARFKHNRADTNRLGKEVILGISTIAMGIALFRKMKSIQPVQSYSRKSA